MCRGETTMGAMLALAGRTKDSMNSSSGGRASVQVTRQHAVGASLAKGDAIVHQRRLRNTDSSHQRGVRGAILQNLQRDPAWSARNLKQLRSRSKESCASGRPERLTAYLPCNDPRRIVPVEIRRLAPARGQLNPSPSRNRGHSNCEAQSLFGVPEQRKEEQHACTSYD
jgi:hypothetical protein